MIRKYISDKEAQFFVTNTFSCASDKPVNGNYKIGDIVISNKQQNDIIGWICIEDGNPGKWNCIYNNGDMNSKIMNIIDCIEIIKKNVDDIKCITGPQGPKGDKGEPGEQGPKGDKGEPGEQGPKGDKGDQGEPGEQGPKGDKGDQGPKGDKGDQGEVGPKGDKGEQGPKGDQGEQGPKGDKGDQGEPGEQGPKGDDGTSVKIEGFVENEEDLNKITDELNVGDGYIVQSNGHLYIYSESNEFIDVGEVRGPKGEQGIQGPKGDKGETGEQGPKGDKGDQGEPGEQGPKGDQGETGEQGPKGDKGDQGEVGPKGDKGEQGPKGDKGDQGEPGEQGPKGDKGDQGIQGPKGDQGEVGPKGDKGEQGPKGDQGETGEQGPKGDQGETGEQGPKGDKGDQGIQGPKGDQGEQGPKGDKGDPGESPDLEIYATKNYVKEKFKYVTVEQFNAVGDGEADDTLSIKTAIQSLYESGGGVLYFTNRRYKISSTINIPQGVTIVGLSANKYSQDYSGSNLLSSGGTIIIPNGDFDIFVIDRAASFSGIKNLAIHYPDIDFLSVSTPSTHCAIKFTTARNDAEYTENVIIENVDICGFQCGICMPWIANESMNYAQYYYTTFRNISIMKCNCGVFLNGMSDIVVDNVFCKDLFGMDLSKINSHTAPMVNNLNFSSAVWTEPTMNLINDLGNSVINKFAVYGGTGHGMLLQDCVSIHFDRAIFASLDNYAGLVVRGCNNKSRIYGLRSALNKYGVIIDSSEKCYSTRIDFISCRIENNYNYGIHIKAGQNINFAQCDISSNSLNNPNIYDGIYADSSNNLVFTSCFLGDEQAQVTQRYCFYGYAGQNCVFMGCDFLGCSQSINTTYGNPEIFACINYKGGE